MLNTWHKQAMDGVEKENHKWRCPADGWEALKAKVRNRHRVWVARNMELAKDMETRRKERSAARAAALAAGAAAPAADGQ